MERALTLADTPLDLQITICIFLHPSDILALRKTCKALELATRQRIVWVAALHRVCLDNTLFLPSFPIPDMSDLELERAAMAPRRWLRRAFHPNQFSETLHPRTTRIIEDANKSHFIIVPGGRYLVTAGIGLSVWDLGYVSTVDCKLLASVGLEDKIEFCVVQVTPDGKGLVILSSYKTRHTSIFEIYPQSEIPLLTQIAHWHHDRTVTSLKLHPAHLLPDTLIFRSLHHDRIHFGVVDYRTHYSTCFSADVKVENINSGQAFGDVETFATKTAIILFCKEGVLIWAIPPLLPEPSDLHKDPLNNNSTHLSPLFKIPLPDGIVGHIPILSWMTASSWYFESWESLYFDISYTDSTLQRFKIIINPDLSDASLHVINMPEIISDSLMDFLRFRLLWPDFVNESYRMCEDALIYFWSKSLSRGAYAGLTSAPFSNVATLWDGRVDALCPTSGRFVYRTDRRGDRIVVVDLF